MEGCRIMGCSQIMIDGDCQNISWFGLGAEPTAFVGGYGG
jgi:hypothetical protein